MEEISPNNILKVSHISASYQEGKQRKTVLHDISFELHENEILGLVGESGCGKSTLSKVILGFIRPDEGEIISQVDHPQMIFQDPFSSLNPRMTISQAIEEPLALYHICPDRVSRQKRVAELMDTVGLARRLYNTYPHELDGGRRQRIGIARALALNPRFIVCDEPVSALDVSIQAQILNLMQDLQKELDLTYMFITHDLSVVYHISDEIMVMYLGQVIEKAPTEKLFANPVHPYTQALLSAIPVPSIHNRRERILMTGELTSPIDPLPECRFANRCRFATGKCRESEPQLREIEPGHFVSCFLCEA